MTVHPHSDGDQKSPAVAALSDGSFVVVWESEGAPDEDPSGAGIVGRFYTADGEPRGDVFQVNRITAGDQRAPDLTALSQNRFLVAWEGANGTIRARRFVAPGADCASSEVLCLGEDGRFEVRVEWRGAGGVSGAGRAFEVAPADSGMFYFFSENNLELLVKVLDGCGLNERFWVFYAATTDLGLTVTVTDTRTGETKTYGHPHGRPAATVTDTAAFATCSAAPAPEVQAEATPLGDEFAVSPESAGYRFRPSVASFPDDSFVVVWVDRERPLDEAAPTQALGRRFGPDLVPRGDTFEIGSMGQGASLEVDTFPSGDFLVVRGSTRSRFRGNGRPMGPERSFGFYPTHASLATGPQGRYVIAWERFEFIEPGFGSVWESDLHSRLYALGGEPLGPSYTLTEPAQVHLFGGGTGTAAVSFADGYFFVVGDSPVAAPGQWIGPDGRQRGDVVPISLAETPALAASDDTIAVLSRGGNREVLGEIFGRFYRRLREPEPPVALCGDDETLCLGEEERFEVRVRFTDPDGGSGTGKIFDLGRRDSGALYFFHEDNLEMLIKVLDGCAQNGHFWVYYAATTTLGLEVSVTDTLTGQTRTYRNPAGRPADAVTDTRAFASCS